MRFWWIVQLDGYMARRLGINSVLGSYLDPLADKVSLVDINEYYYCHYTPNLDHRSSVNLGALECPISLERKDILRPV